jgi:hypothetical protein
VLDQKTIMFNKIAATVFALSIFSVFAQKGASTDDLQLNAITTALPFMSINPDSRGGGMGDAGTALSANSTSVYWNTSNLIFAEEDAEIGISYVPWLRQLTNDIHLSYLSGYSKLSDRHVVGGALRYFSLGSITYTDDNANILREDKPSEFEFTGAYAFRLTDKMAIGLNGKFAYSNLTGGLTTAGIDSKPAIAGATDVSFTYFNEDARYGSNNGSYTFAATLNNVGNKVSYSSSAKRDFIPMTLKLANALKFDLDDYNSLTWAFELQRLLVPTPPIYRDGDLVSGKNNDVGVITGLLQSFSDAPGKIAKDENGDEVKNDDGTYQIVKNSKFKEELAEINIATGFEYIYNNTIAIRTGLFYESPSKGGRQFFNAGVGLKYNSFRIDVSYLGALGGRNSPLANTLRFTLRLVLGDKKA